MQGATPGSRQPLVSIRLGVNRSEQPSPEGLGTAGGQEAGHELRISTCSLKKTNVSRAASKELGQGREFSALLW